ncbi:unnamed protein product [Symbiodinium sp. CCMP2592]|nr:unnamed protein product [Symbiodinium sp. CCMP2592]
MADVPVPETTAEEEFDLFGPGPAPEGAQQEANPFAPVQGPAPAPTQAAQPSVPAAGSPAGATVPPVQSPKASAPPVQSPKAAAPSSSSGSAGFTPEQMPGFMMELLRQQREMMAMNQQLVATMLRRMDLEEERRNKAEEKVHEAAEAAKQAAEAAKTRDPFQPSTAPASSSAASSAVPPAVPSPSGYSGAGGRAEKYLPNLPVIDHQGMGKGRMKEVETWHSFMETLRSELLRSCSKRQGQSACGYEVIRTITSQYSIVSRMEAVFVREQSLKLYQHVGHMKRPTDLIRHLEDSFSKSEAKLSNFPELKLSEADRCSVLLQSLSAEVRQYVVLHGSSSDWEALRKTLTYYEEQLRLCEAPGSSGRALQEKLCDYCGKKGHTADKCWQRQKDERGGAPKGKGKGDKGKPKGKGDQTPKGSGKPRGSEKGKGDRGKGDKGKDKGKKQKKKKKGQPGKGRSLTEPESEAESGGSATVMAMRFSCPGKRTTALRERPASRSESAVDSESSDLDLRSLTSSSEPSAVSRLNFDCVFGGYETMLHALFQAGFTAAENLGADLRDLDLEQHVQSVSSMKGAASPGLGNRSWSDVTPSRAAAKGKSSKWMKCALHSASWVDVLDHKRSAALEKWKIIILSSGEETALGKELLASQQEGSPEAIDDSISDAFRRKATSTLRTRAASLLMFCRWRANESGCAVVGLFPLDEKLAYDYVAHLRRCKAPRTRAPRFLEALGFAKGLLGANVQAILDSARVRGAAEGTAEVEVKKAPPLKCHQLKFLEWFAATQSGQEAVFIGHVCFCVHARLRWGDSQYCALEPFIDLCDGNRLLPAVAVTPGVSGEASTWLGEILRRHDIEGLGPGSGTRSFKPTLLSWMTKSGAPPGLQRLAGYHIEPGSKNPLEYGRDAMAPVLQYLESLLSVMAAGLFEPDRTRSGRWIGCRSLEDALRQIARSSGSGHGSDLWRDAGVAPLDSAQSFDDALRGLADPFVRGTSPDPLQCEGDLQAEPAEPDEDWDAAYREAGFDGADAGGIDFENDLGRSSEGASEEGAESSSCSLQDEEESDDADRLAELAGPIVAEAVVGGADLPDSSLFRHVVSGILHRARVLNPDEDGKGWGTFANFAFSTSFIPGQGEDSVFVRDVVVAVLGSSDHASAAALRRLHFESYTLTAAELKRQTEATESDLPRKLPPAEIASRIEALQRKVLPLLIEDSLEPSHAVVNLVSQCVEDQRVRYIELCRVTTRNQEVNSLKEVPSLKMLQPDRSGVLRAVPTQDSLRAAVSTELEVFQALRRRDIAYELGGYMSFAAHEQLVCFLIRELQKDTLPGCGRVTLNQVQSADREVHIQLARKTRAGFEIPGPGELPLDDHLAKVLEMPSIHWILMPPRLGGKSAPVEVEDHESLGTPTGTKKRKRKKKKQPVKETEAGKVPPPPEPPANQPDRKKFRGVLPQALRGGVSHTKAGAPICYGHNLGTCGHTGDRCDKGSFKVAAPPSVLPSDLKHVGHSPTDFPARVEQLARTMSDRPTADDLLQLFAELPGEVMCRFLRMQAPHRPFGALAIFQNLKADLHRDINNDGGLSAAFIRLGGDALGVDRVVRSRTVRAPAVKLDLTRADHQALIKQEVQRADVVWLAPPCGTGSRARDIPLPTHLPADASLSAKPLRSAAHPEGLPDLAGTDARRVRSANQLYAFSSEILELCVHLGKVCVVENPRPLVCYPHSDGQHAHKSWGVARKAGRWNFQTSGTAAYPPAFCKAAASDLIDICASFNAFPRQEVVSDTFAVAAAVGRQPRGFTHQVGPSEFGSTCTMRVPLHVAVPDIIDSAAPWPLQGLPSGSRLLSSRTLSDNGGSEGVREVKFGIYRTPEAFLAEASKTRHPFDVPSNFDMGNIQAMQVILSQGVEGVKNLRERVLSYYKGREAALRPEEEALRATMDPEVRKVMEGKNFLLFQGMLRDAGVEDPHLLRDMTQGFRLIGPLEPSGQFPRKLRPAGIDVSHLKAMARWSKHLVEASCRRAVQDQEIAKAVWSETMEQVEKAWLKGPFSWEEIDKKYQGCWVPSKRFGVAQADKVRSVDDLSEFLINAAVTETEKIMLEGIDHIVSLARFFIGATTAGVSSFKLPSSSEEWITGQVHPDWRAGRARRLFGRALDLKAAYKQLARHPDDGWVSVLAVLDPDKDVVHYFEAVALPFGAVSSVTGFNRTARALRKVLTNLFFLITTNFYDDYCQMELEPLRDSARTTAEAVLDLLGWKIAQGIKALPFSQSFNMLGACISFENAYKGEVVVRNKEGRLEAIEEIVQQCIAKRRCDPKAILSVKGKLLFAAGNVFGKCAQIATQLISQCGSDGFRMDRERTDVLLTALQFALNTLKSSGARCVGAWSQQPPVLVFTDGACEQEGSLVIHGALLYDPVSGRKEVFGDHVPESLVAAWKRGGRKQVIYFAEIFPVVVAKATWKDVIAGRRVLFFLDNEGARFTFIRSYSAQVNATSLLMQSAKLDVESRVLGWYSRVPSKSNPSDAASRLAFDSYSDCRRVSPVYDALLPEVS